MKCYTYPAHVLTLYAEYSPLTEDMLRVGNLRNNWTMEDAEEQIRANFCSYIEDEFGIEFDDNLFSIEDIDIDENCISIPIDPVY